MIRRWWFIVCSSFVVTWVILYLPTRRPKPVPSSKNLHWIMSQRTVSELVQPVQDSVILSPARPCEAGSDGPFLVVVVCSSPVNFAGRRAIRNTWGRGAKVFFLLGRSRSNRTDDIIKAESEVHSDIVQYDFLDTYTNLTLKSVLMMRWISQACPNARYLMKADDDVYISVPNLIDHLRSANYSALLLGRLITKSIPIKDESSKWYLPDSVYSEPFYPDYLSGLSYVVSGDILSSLYLTALNTTFFYLEDIFVTGICARRLGIALVNNDEIHFTKQSDDPCYLKSVISLHRISPQEMVNIWNIIRDSEVTCIPFWNRVPRFLWG